MSKREVIIPKKIVDAMKLHERQKVRVKAVGDEIVIKPIRDAIWLALYSKKIGKIMPEEVEEESISRQEKFSQH